MANRNNMSKGGEEDMNNTLEAAVTLEAEGVVEAEVADLTGVEAVVDLITMDRMDIMVTAMTGMDDIDWGFF